MHTRIEIREAKLTDYLRIHSFYDTLSFQTKMYFRPPFLNKKPLLPTGREPLILDLMFLLSLIKTIRNIMLNKLSNLLIVLPVFISFIAVDGYDNVVGFCYIMLKRKKNDKHLVGSLGIAVKDNYQGKGIGSLLLETVLKAICDYDIKRITLGVVKDNVRAIKLYKKFGFKIYGVDRIEYWYNRKLIYYKMVLDL